MIKPIKIGNHSETCRGVIGPFQYRDRSQWSATMLVVLALVVLALVVSMPVSQADSPAPEKAPLPATPAEQDPAEAKSLAPSTLDPVEMESFQLATPGYDYVRQLSLEWIDGQSQLAPDKQTALRNLWPETSDIHSAENLLALVMETFATADSETARLLESCQQFAIGDPVPQIEFLLEKHPSPFYQNHLQLYLGHYLVQRSLFDGALAILETVDPQQVVDPATLFYDRAVCHHQLLQKKEALAAIKVLLDHPTAAPSRYVMIARLMQSDLEEIQSKPVGEIAHLMKDSQRRLRLAQSDKKVRNVQTEIVDRLDKLIEEIEKQQQQQQNSQSNSSGQNPQSQDQPAPDSIIKGAAGEGKVDKKDFNSKGGWGALPPKERTRARNLIDRQFPPHYRRQVEEYFKKLSKRRGSSGQ